MIHNSTSSYDIHPGAGHTSSHHEEPPSIRYWVIQPFILCKLSDSHIVCNMKQKVNEKKDWPMLSVQDLFSRGPTTIPGLWPPIS